MENKPFKDLANEFGFEALKPEDTFQFACTNCCECCRNITDAVMIEPLDLFRIAKYTCRSIEETVEEFTEPVMLSWGFPIFVLKTRAFMDSCVFLKNSRCSIHDAKPRACRLYPLSAGPDETDINSIISLMDVKRKNKHTCGPTHRVKDWMDTYFTGEDRRFIRADFQFAAEFAKIKKAIDKKNEERVMQSMFLHRYFMFDLEADFVGQFVRNMAALKGELQKLCVK